MDFNATITAAVRDFEAHGYDSPQRLAAWVERLRVAARASLVPEADLVAALQRVMGANYAKLVDGGGIDRAQGVQRWTVEKVRPQLRAELDRRIIASADLIRLNRTQAVEKTLQRFTGWATSIPAGGSRAVEKREVKGGIRKSLVQLPFEERRVIIDQGHKLNAALNQIVAVDSGAIAGIWRSKWRQPGYNYRDPHKKIDGDYFTIRGNWAQELGLMKPGPAGYTDEVPEPAQLPFCRCAYQFVFSIRDLPPEMVTQKGRDELARVRAAIQAG